MSFTRETWPNQSAAANSRRAFRLRVAGDLTLAPALHRRAPAAVAELGSLDDITRMASEPPKDFTVKFGKYAHTVEYDDPEAHILFTFDIDGPHSITLEHHAPSMPRHPRYPIAFQRVKQFLEKPGTEVNIYGS